MPRRTNQPWQVIGASVPGRRHRERGIPCQDAHASCLTLSGVLIVAVADGAGSASHADAGARACVQSGLQPLAARFRNGSHFPASEIQKSLLEAFVVARASLDHLASKRNLPLPSFATTLTIGVVTANQLSVGQIGDGLCVARDKEGELFTTIPPHRGEYANETAFLTNDDALNLVEVCNYPRSITGLAVMTDGLIRLAMNLEAGEPHAPFFEPLLEFAAQQREPLAAAERLQEFLDSDRVCARTDDDKTLVLATRILGVGDAA